MAEPAKWIKISTDTFEDEKIDIIEGMPSGDEMIVVWFKILLLAGKCNAGGYLLIQDDIPFTPEMLARRFKKNINIVNLALGVFEKYKMIQSTDKGIYITNFNKYQDLDKLNKKREQDRARQQKKREKEKLLLEAAKEETGAGEDMSRVTSRDNMCDINRDFERDSSYSTSTSISNNSSSNIYNLNIDNISNNHAKTQNEEDNFLKFYERNFGRLMTPYEYRLLNSYIEDGMEPAVITMALAEAIEFDRKDFNYIKKILNRWIESGIKTVEAVKADKAEFEKKQRGDKNGTRCTGKNNAENKYEGFRPPEPKLLSESELRAIQSELI